MQVVDGLDYGRIKLSFDALHVDDARNVELPDERRECGVELPLGCGQSFEDDHGLHRRWSDDDVKDGGAVPVSLKTEIIGTEVRDVVTVNVLRRDQELAGYLTLAVGGYG